MGNLGVHLSHLPGSSALGSGKCKPLEHHWGTPMCLDIHFAPPPGRPSEPLKVTPERCLDSPLSVRWDGAGLRPGRRRSSWAQASTVAEGAPAVLTVFLLTRVSDHGPVRTRTQRVFPSETGTGRLREVRDVPRSHRWECRTGPWLWSAWQTPLSVYPGGLRQEPHGAHWLPGEWTGWPGPQEKRTPRRSEDGILEPGPRGLVPAPLVVRCPPSWASVSPSV